tara:strand:- start:704 stop:931 length:228 start_codon:yes stop_codon:yes gene_type:complete
MLSKESTHIAKKRVQCVKMACVIQIQQAESSARYVMEMKTMSEEEKQMQLLEAMNRQAIALEHIARILERMRLDA